jgi:hypothetical protein
MNLASGATKRHWRYDQTMNTALAAATLALCIHLTAEAAPQIKPGAYRVDVNGKVRALCVDEITNAELSAKGWRVRLADQGVRCELADIKRGVTTASWVGRCASPGMGKVFNTEHRVRVEINADQSFTLHTRLSGDLQADIPVRGEPVAGTEAACTSQHDTFRPWQ